MQTLIEKNQSIFMQALELVNDRYAIEKSINQSLEYNASFGCALKNDINLIAEKRLANWLDYFNENYSKSPCIYTETVQAIINANLNNELFKAQSEYERKLSFEFYAEIFKAPFLISICNYWSAEYLLSTALVFGKYPGMLVRSLKKGVLLLKNGLTEKSVQDLFTFLFVQYENPNIFIRNLIHLNANEIDVLLYALQGNSIRRHPHLEGQLSKKEASFLWLKLGDKFELTNQVLERGIIFSKLASVTNNTEGIFRFCEYSRTFKYRLEVFSQDIEFWKSAFRILSKEASETSSAVGLYLDYLEYKKYQDDAPFNLKRTTFKSLDRQVKEWHNKAEYLKQQAQINSKWTGMKLGNYSVNYKNTNYHFSEITSGKALFKESELMNHCVFSYINECIAGNSFIWSLKQEQNGLLVNHLTIEVKRKLITQIAGYKNASPTQADLEIIISWADQFDLVFLARDFE